jgi:hypothetical protein
MEIEMEKDYQNAMDMLDEVPGETLTERLALFLSWCSLLEVDWRKQLREIESHDANPRVRRPTRT